MNKYMNNFDTIRFVVTWSIFGILLIIFQFLIQIQIFEP
jgi:hypothetical protein